MSKKTRLIILISCVVCFLLVAPVLVLYSEGYRFDFEKMGLTETGGIFISTLPSADQITVDSTISQKPGFLLNSVFIQSLLPKDHSVLIVKQGYFDYTKTLPVKGKGVTKLEKVLLFKKDLKFTQLLDNTKSPFLQEVKNEKYILKTNNLYYADVPQNSTITATVKKVALLKNIVAFEAWGSKILWLGVDGFLYQAEASAVQDTVTKQEFSKINFTPLTIVKKGVYKITTNGQNILVNNNGKLLLLNSKTNSFNLIADLAANEIISPDGKNLIYSINNEVYLYTFSADPTRTFLEVGKNNLIYKANDEVTSTVWLNNEYIIFVNGNDVIVSEIDFRGNVNWIVIPTTIKIAGTTVQIISPEIIFNQQENKLYILSNLPAPAEDKIIISEKLVP